MLVSITDSFNDAHSIHSILNDFRILVKKKRIKKIHTLFGFELSIKEFSDYMRKNKPPERRLPGLERIRLAFEQWLKESLRLTPPMTRDEFIDIFQTSKCFMMKDPNFGSTRILMVKDKTDINYLSKSAKPDRTIEMSFLYFKLFIRVREIHHLIDKLLEKENKYIWTKTKFFEFKTIADFSEAGFPLYIFDKPTPFVLQLNILQIIDMRNGMNENCCWPYFQVEFEEV